MLVMAPSLPIEALKGKFGDRFQVAVELAPYTAARIGGPADGLLSVNTGDRLAEAGSWLSAAGVPFFVMGGGSNILVSDQGVRGVVLLNRARRLRFDLEADPPVVWAESGTGLIPLARQAASRGLGGLAWAAGIPGTLGGAIVGNAGAHGAELADNLALAEILHLKRGREVWEAERFSFGYRSSVLKTRPGEILILAAQLRLEKASKEAIKDTMDSFLAYRRRTQPPGASMGSMFKNPPGDYAGRLIEAAGLKGYQIGDAEISPLHANFFINHGAARAGDVLALIQMAKQRVKAAFGVDLALEIELVGDWTDDERR